LFEGLDLGKTAATISRGRTILKAALARMILQARALRHEPSTHAGGLNGHNGLPDIPVSHPRSMATPFATNALADRGFCG